MSEDPLPLNPEEIEWLSQVLTDALIQSQPQTIFEFTYVGSIGIDVQSQARVIADAVIQAKPIPTYANGGGFNSQIQPIEVINLDLMASCTHGWADILGEISGWFTSFINSVAFTIISSIQSFITTFVTPAISSIGDFLKGVIPAIGTALAGIPSFITDKIISPLTNFFTISIPSFFASVTNFFTVSIPSFFRLVTDFFTRTIPLYFGTVGDFFTRTLPTYFSSVADFFTRTLPSFFGSVTDFFTRTLPSLFARVTDFFTSTLPAFFGSVADFFTRTLPTLFVPVVDFFTRTLPSLFGSVVDFFSKTLPTLFAPLTDFFTRTLPSLFTSVVDFFTRTLPTLFSPVVDFFTKTLPALFVPVVDFFTKTIPSLFGSVTDFFTRTLPTLFAPVVDFFTKTLPALFSPIIDFFSKTIPSLFGYVVNFFTNTLPSLFSPIIDFFTKTLPALFSPVVRFFTETIPTFFGFVTNFFTVNVPAFFNQVINFFTVTLPALFNGLITFFTTDLPAWVKENVVPILTGLLPPLLPAIRDALMEPVVYGKEEKGAKGTVYAPPIVMVRTKLAIPIIGNIESIIRPLYDPSGWIEDTLKPTLSSPPGFWEKISEFFGKVWDLIVGAIQGVAQAIWNAINSFFKWLVDTIVGAFKALAETVWSGIIGLFKGVAKALTETLYGFVGHISETAKGQIHELIGGIGKTITGLAQWVYEPLLTDLEKSYKDNLGVVAEKLGKGSTWVDDVAEGFKFFTATTSAVLGAHYLGFGLSQALHALASICDELRPMPQALINGEGGCALEPIGIGARLRALLGFALSLGWHIKPSYILREIAKDVRELSDTFTRGLVYGYTIWMSQPLQRLYASAFRNILVIELPTIADMREIVQRHMGYGLESEEFVKMLDTYRTFLRMYGYRDDIIDWLTSEKLKIEVTDRFGTKRTVPLSMMFELPSASDVATMMVRDIFATVEDFDRLYRARGMHPDIGILYYFLRFRYPPPERLWQFTVRGISGLLWATLPNTEIAEIEKETKYIKALMPVAPVTLNFQADKLMSAFKMYMKWHDYFRGCIPEGTIILGDNKPIEEYKAGDYTIYGGKVIATFKRPYKGKVIKIKAHNMLELRLTREHVLPVITGTRKWVIVEENGIKKDKFILELSKPYYKHADEIVPAPKCELQHRHSGDYLIVPRLKGQLDIKELSLERYIMAKTDVRNYKITLDEDFAWLLGFYVAEGYTQEKYVSFGQSIKNAELIEKLCRIIRKIGYSPVISKTRSVWEIYVKSPILSRAFAEWCGKGASNKKIPDFILLHKDDRILNAFLDGYFAGDGYTDEQRQEKGCSTKSQVLAMQLQLALLRLGYISSIHERRREGLFTIRFTTKEHTHHLSWLTDDYALFPVQKVECEDYEGTVYDLEVENSHYLVSNAIVHNSWIPGFTSDNLIYIDTLADIPTKIDQRWICVPPDTLILGDNKPICEYNIGEYVLYGGRVYETFKRPYKGQLVIIKGLGLLPIKVTPEHPIFVAEGRIEWVYYVKNGKRMATTRKVITEPKFIEAKDVQLYPIRSCGKIYIFRRKGHYLVVPRVKGTVDIRELDLSSYYRDYARVPIKIKRNLGILAPKITLDENMAWLMGFYVAEGSISSKSDGLQIEFANLNEKYRQKVISIISRLGFKPSITRSTIMLSSNGLARAFKEWFGHCSDDKRIPDFILLHKNEEILKAFLEGYFAGDGHVQRDGKFECTTTSKTLALQLQLLAFRLGYSCSISIKDYGFGWKRQYRSVIITRRDEKHARILFDDNYVYIPIIKIDYEPYDGYVYNLETEKNVYLVSNAIVHNCKWGLYELLSAKQVTIQSPVREFATKILETTPTSEIKMNITNFSRTLLATGLHPDWVPVTAVAEVMNALTEERTALRTGFMGLFKEGFYDIQALEKLLAGFVTASFNVAYFDITTMQWTTGWVNIPVMYLPPERKLLELRALMDRSLDILRDIQRDISTAYQEFIIWDYNEYKSKLTQVIESINTFYASDYKAITGKDLPSELKLKFVEAYYRPYIEALRVWREVYTIRRLRMWTQRWLGWVMYRVAYGVVEKEDVDKLITYVSEKARLTDYETEFIKQVMNIMYGIARRNVVAEYLPTPSTLATLSEYMTLPTELVRSVLTERGIPEQWMNIWLTYITVKPIKADAKALLSTYIRGLRYGAVTKEKLENFIKALPQYGFTDKEIQFITERVSIEEQILDTREYVPTPSTLATLSEYVVISQAVIEKVLQARRIPKEWAEIWKQYIDVRPIADDVRGLLTSYRRALLYAKIPEDLEKKVMEYAKLIGFTQREIDIMTLRVQLEELIIQARESQREYIPTPSMLATICEYIPEARQFFTQVMQARRVPADWQKVWAKYIDIRPLVDEIKKYLSRAENLYVYFMIKQEDFKKVLDEVSGYLGYTPKEVEFLMKITELERAYRAWTELIGTVERLVTLSEYSPKASKYALGKLNAMIDSLPLSPTEKQELKEIWEEYIRVRPVKSEVERYITDLINLYVEGLISDLDFGKELESLKRWGLSDDEITFYKAIAGARKARKLKIPVAYGE